ncbi:hypothetical protein DEF23_15575 [Marinitenerispora sediminis]|uniref:Uncharacterized protein n=2 Tax=Marinitenerispora sediminis TaxID=1931232 RepID=A0A368T7M2_9ACTN|nr:hypothetical protein DEF23_15575 [Marinitenerispora sediminis]RCV56409.1 hypothetical protein DEF28_03650 [Marinitenerispora sediminis]RCV59753.1 hypothetical protein DEF24_08975 [Marinitenerispora sediminis]
MLEEGVTRAHLPRALAELSAGRPVGFGPVTATPHALAIDRTEIPWGEISGVTIEDGYLDIKRTGKLFTTSQQVGYVPDFLVLVALVREYTGASLDQPAPVSLRPEPSRPRAFRRAERLRNSGHARGRCPVRPQSPSSRSPSSRR